jgi:hypothetical protein
MASLLTKGGTTILSLLNTCRPATVTGPVSSVVINSFNSEIGSVPISERPVPEWDVLVPFVTDSDPSTSVIGPGFVMGIAAALPHTSPNIPKPSSRFSVSGRSLYSADLLFTAAGEGISRSEVCKQNGRSYATTITATINKPAVSEVLSNDMNDGEIAKSLTRCWNDCRIPTHVQIVPELEPSSSIKPGGK